MDMDIDIRYKQIKNFKIFSNSIKIGLLKNNKAIKLIKIV